MPIKFLPETAQKNVVLNYNESKTKFEKIPLVPRNAATGWPLFQVSLFSPLNDQKYGLVLGGGKCHYFHIGAFNLASLLTKIPGAMEIEGNYQEKKDRVQLKADNVAMFLETFAVEHRSLGIKIDSKAGRYGKVLSIKCPEGDPIKLAEALEAVFSFCVKKKSGLIDIGTSWGEEQDTIFTEEQIRSGINENTAIFSEGQIFVDLGKFLQQAVADEDLEGYFKGVFKVDEFCALTNVSEEKEEHGGNSHYLSSHFECESSDSESSESDFFDLAITIALKAHKARKVVESGTDSFYRDTSSEGVELFNPRRKPHYKNRVDEGDLSLDNCLAHP